MARLLTVLGLVGATVVSLVAGQVTNEPDPDGPNSEPSSLTEASIRSLAVKEKDCCRVLMGLDVLREKTFPAEGAGYAGSLKSYWSAQESNVHPACIFRPQTTKDVSAGVFALTIASKAILGGCPFAVRGGGHTPWAGAANIQGGVTIDTQSLNQIAISADQKFVSIGPGNRWGDVYQKLDALELATSGGRVSPVGVAGLTLGGGISFFSPRYGLVCDNVLNYEIVLANSTITNVNTTSSPDLFKALKGGSNNFGIVTRFDMKVFRQGKFWGGFVVNAITEKENIFTRFFTFAKSTGYDPFAALIVNFSFSNMPGRSGWSIANNIEYTKPTPNPPVFAPFTELPQLLSTMRISNLTDFTLELATHSPPGGRDLFATTTFKNDAATMSRFFDLANATALTLATANDLTFSLSFQPLPQAVTSPGFATTAGAGNALGLSENDGDLVNVLLTVQWSDVKDDAAIDQATKRLFADFEKESKVAGTFHPYLYLNYAAQWQRPIEGYGAESGAFLNRVSTAYDPEKVFQRMVPGGFKLGGGFEAPTPAEASG